jgi:hypothetical protein
VSVIVVVVVEEEVVEAGIQMGNLSNTEMFVVGPLQLRMESA